MRSLFVLTMLALAACDTNQDDLTAKNDRPNPERPPPGKAPPGSEAGRPMGRPDGNVADGRPMGRGDMNSFRVDPTDPNSAVVEELVATLSGDPKHKDLRGKVTLRVQGGNVLVDTTAAGLPPGEHGYHVHVYGDCSALDAKSPGEHFDFKAAMAGENPPGSNTMGGGTRAGTNAGTGSGTGTGTGGGTGSGSGVPKSMDTTATDMAMMNGSHVMGNLGELVADKNGHAMGSMTLESLRLRPLVGRAVVIHEKGNDDSKPDGAAGNPIACGVIGIANPEVKASASKEPDQK